MLKNIKLFSANFRWYLRTLSVSKVQNINIDPRSTILMSEPELSGKLERKSQDDGIFWQLDSPFFNLF